MKVIDTSIYERFVGAVVELELAVLVDGKEKEGGMLAKICFRNMSIFSV